MPIYEYRCQGCGRKISLLVRGSSKTPVCSHCGSADLNRLLSTFAMHRTDQAIYEDILTDNRLIRGMESNDPRALADWNRRMSRGADTDGSDSEYGDVLGRMERGEMPTSDSDSGSGGDED
ncbi:MAG: zinc ribbon domain-containing protein [Dehalococcoidia bacterium]|nr:zinc ribbon domain-containing protein [Dehalococcoidia bacterium]